MECDNGLQLLDLLLGESILAQLSVDVVDAYFVELVDGNCDIHNLIGSSDDLGDTSEYLAVVYLDLHANAKTGEYRVDNLHELHLVNE